MCQLFAISSAKPQLINEPLSEFFTHSVDNPHGWGYADFSQKNSFVFKSPEKASVSDQAKLLVGCPLAVTDALAHIRYATVGDIEEANAHPFTAHDISGRHWTLIHKGTIFSSDRLDSYFHTQTGSTDSERILLYLIDRINEATDRKDSPLEPDERFAIFESIALELSPDNCVNLIVYDSDQFYIHSNYAAGLNVLNAEKSVVFSTSPLTSAAAEDDWQPLILCTAFAYKHGSLLYTGTQHTFEYYDKTTDAKYLYQDYAAL
jgi:glutamine amidotransferase